MASALGKVIYVGESNESLRKGMTYSVVSMQRGISGVYQYTLKGIEGAYNRELFQSTRNRRTPYIAVLRSPIPPVEGECIQNLSLQKGNGEWETVNTDKVKKVYLISYTGNVYAVYTKNETYIISYFETEE